MIDAVIFDMDGVLVDNFEAWTDFDKKFLAQFNIIPDDEYYLFVNGRSEEEVIDWVKDRYKLNESVEDIWKSRQEWIRKVYELGSKPAVAIEDLIKKIRQSGMKVALCSGAKMWQINIVLDLFNWQDYFDVIVSAEHVGYKGKPDPEIYLHTARLLDVNPKKCLVFEDAENGVKAAKSANMQCIGYKNPRFDLPDNLSQADFIVNSFADKKILEFLNI